MGGEEKVRQSKRRVDDFLEKAISRDVEERKEKSAKMDKNMAVEDAAQASPPDSEEEDAPLDPMSDDENAFDATDLHAAPEVVLPETPEYDDVARTVICRLLGPFGVKVALYCKVMEASLGPPLSLEDARAMGLVGASGHRQGVGSSGGGTGCDPDHAAGGHTSASAAGEARPGPPPWQRGPELP